MPDPLFQPIFINRLEVRNRIYMPAMHLGMAADFQVTDQIVDFYAERARALPEATRPRQAFERTDPIRQ